MGIKQLFQSKGGKQTKDAAMQVAVASTSPVCDLFREGIYLKQELTERLMSKATSGVQFFNTYNDTRLSLTFASFDKAMELALYEIIYLLNINEPWLERWKYKPQRFSGKNQTSEGEAETNLYVKDAPFGVKGIDRLSDRYCGKFYDYIEKEFGNKVVPAHPNGHFPIDGIYSIGSIGTIGHKNIASDLDLEVQYDLEPFLFDVKTWKDDLLKQAMYAECTGLINRYLDKKKIDPSDPQLREKKAKIGAFFKQRIAEKYPLLFKQLISHEGEIVEEIRGNKNSKLRSQLVREAINLMKMNARTAQADQVRQRECLLRERIGKIQTYVQTKFPDVEVYLFPFSLHEFRKGCFGSTLESKESSGGAYELILNYETLMPGTYFTPNVPSHFLFPAEINNSDEKFDKLIEYLRFGVVSIYHDISHLVINQGPTPNMNLAYVAQHYSAVYWEAFKASYGNLPKATLNLLRYETLLENSIGLTIIQLIKSPNDLDELVYSAENIENVLIGKAIFSPQGVLEIEKEFPLLLYDPWWLRYKVLKIAYGVPGLVAGLMVKDLVMISRTIDLAFALHVRLSDVFTTPGDQRKFDKHREQVLCRLLEKGFPEKTATRTRLYATFIGDVETVSSFERDLREVFQNCVTRVRKKAASHHVDEKTTKEFEVWHHYYEKNFIPQPNVIQRSILSHLQIPRGRLQIGYRPKEGWFFKSLQKESQVGRRFESTIMNLLPDEISLIKDTQFLYGLVYCVINGYYGIFGAGTLKETRTAVEYDRKYTNLGSKYDNHLAFVRPDQIERIMQRIIRFNTPIKVGYLDCINKEREIIGVMVFLNLLRYGRLSILYRDNLDTLYVEEFDLPGFAERAEHFMTAHLKMFKSMILHKTLGRFFRRVNITPEKVEFSTWVNTNCVETTHAMTNEIAKEDDLAETLRQIIVNVHSQQPD